MLKVNLLRYTPEGEKLIASAAKLCYSPVGVEEIEKDLDKESTNKFLNMLVGLGHDSPIEHINFTFAVEGVSRTLTHQLVRHRIASYSQQSQRYVKLENFEYIIPPSIKKDEEAREIFIKAMERDSQDYKRLVNVLYGNNLKKYSKEDKKAEYKAEKEAIEDARYVFPNACETKIVFTMNARTLLNFFSLRTCNRAQWEIRVLAEEMLHLVKEVYPNLFSSAGPRCIRGKCPEGAMTCGDIKNIRKKYGVI